jgi:hypothetical protein
MRVREMIVPVLWAGLVLLLAGVFWTAVGPGIMQNLAANTVPVAEEGPVPTLTAAQQEAAEELAAASIEVDATLQEIQKLETIRKALNVVLNDKYMQFATAMKKADAAVNKLLNLP